MEDESKYQGNFQIDRGILFYTSGYPARRIFPRLPKGAGKPCRKCGRIVIEFIGNKCIECSKNEK